MKLLVSTILSAFAAAAASSPSVTIDAGVLQGGLCSGGQNAVFYKAIPYGEPPVGDLRFEPPKAYNKKFPEGGLNATASAPTCLQYSDDFTPKLTTSEDCLYLDVWAPSDATKDSALPVKVWIYGGSNTEGSISDPLYDGCNTAEEGAILVTVNYRLGPLGFLALNSAEIYGNQGIQDLVLGLQWVQNNIAAFGGDPKKVVLFGESAGAEDAYIVASLPQAPSLINSVISESGGGRSLVLNSSIQRAGASYAKTLGCSTSDKACLQSKTAAELSKAYTDDTYLSDGVGSYGALGILGPISHSLYAYADGHVIPEDPYVSGVNVPAVFGYNENEGLIFATQWATSRGNTPSPSAYKDFLRKTFGPAASLVGKYYPLSLFEAAVNGSSLLSGAAALGINATEVAVIAAMATVVTDQTYKCSAYHGAAQATSKNIPAWTYEFTHNSTCMWLDTIPQKYVSLFAATHTAEIPFVFGNLDNSFLPNGTCNSTASEYALSTQMRSLWTAMADQADPSTDEINWPRFQTTAKNLTTPGLIFGKSAAPGIVDYTGCELWSEVNAILSASNATTTPTPSTGISPATSTPPLTNAAVGIFHARGVLAFTGLLLGPTVFL
ncbi:alpha-esterase [Talaromyces islandicus]|uniref:Carboxylic ester hydrolase n=1 Tax=Talaromyces islandicus TaxID=28573 RepID=A0A0U1LZE6_TALIS|nr:alpha-esterase [Talaromyces islandicus]